ncbi:MAG: glycoside hydrolase family 78 protein [Bacteroidales bacterium]|nr:glycoside hydrolase family 78 protein [Bacteroidales bacterium]
MRTHISIIAITLLLFLCSCKNSGSSISVSQIKCNGIENPVGTGNVPDFSWILKSDKRDQIQTAYQIVVSSARGIINKGKGDVWDTGKIVAGKSSWISYRGARLEPGRKYFWKVRVWDGNDKPSSWSEPGEFVTGLFEKVDWSGARWIGYEEIPDSLLLVPGVHGNGDNLGNVAVKRSVVPYFRKEVPLEKKITQAYVFISGLGQYELSINGNRIGDHFLSPGWSDYRKTCFYNTFDVTENLTRGLNALGVIVGNGFYNINRERYRKLVIAYGAPKMILKLEIRYSDGSKEIIVSDESWKTSPSPITFSSIYGGEDCDARLEQDGWNTPRFNDAAWRQAMIVKEPLGILRPENDYPVKVSEVIDHKKISFHKDSIYVYDFEQNASGIIKIKIKGKKGQEVRFIPGELLGEDSIVTQKATGSPFRFSYTLKGENEEIWMPRFTYYGFRYVQADGALPAGYPNPGNLPVIRDIQLLHTRNSSPETGAFKCSNELFNSIYDLINWSIKSNMASVSTDCPHREKLGWLEQAHLMGGSIKFIYDIHNFYDKIIDDMMEAQLENGLVPDIAPEFVPFSGGFRDSPEWGSACVILPWYMYEWYGDIESVRKAYPMMKRYLNYLEGLSENHILSHGLGDWFDLGPKSPGVAQLTPKTVTATSIYFYDTRLLGKMADLIGETEDALYYKTLAEEIRKEFNRKFFDSVSKVYSTGSQTAYSMPLFFGMVDDSCKNDVVENLVKSINENNKALTAGDIGYRYLLRVLEQEGQSQLIYEMNSKTDVPGYGYQVSKGATSLTESWAALKYVSNNHMMLGHLMEWFYSGICGIRQVADSGSYDNILITPEIVGDLTWAEAKTNSIHGEIRSSWKIEKDILTIRVNIPVNCKAVVAVPQSDPTRITENNIPIAESREVKVISEANGKTLCGISSGEYLFKTPFIK